MEDNLNIRVSEVTEFDQQVAAIRYWLTKGRDSGRLWDLLTALRGPDNPSETGNMSPEAARIAYKGRRDLKFKTVEIIRSVSGLCGGGARRHSDKAITLPKDQGSWTHFHKHAANAARALGLGINYE